MIKDLKLTIDSIKAEKGFKPYKKKFPHSSALARYPEKQIPIIVEQAEKIIESYNNQKKAKVAGKTISSDDCAKLSEVFLKEINLFLTENETYIKNYQPLWSQQVISSNALYHIACSRELQETYESVDLLMNPVNYDSFSMPFIIRLAIESKLKGMIGFLSCDVTRNRRVKKNTDEFPVSKILMFLKGNEVLKTPCDFSIIQNIYSWSCKFTHTGKREYIWMKLKALECLHDLFDYNINKKYQATIGYSTLLCYLKKGVSIDILMKRINNDPYFKGKHKLKLSTEKFDEHLSFYGKDL